MLASDFRSVFFLSLSTRRSFVHVHAQQIDPKVAFPRRAHPKVSDNNNNKQTYQMYAYLVYYIYVCMWKIWKDIFLIGERQGSKLCIMRRNRSRVCIPISNWEYPHRREHIIIQYAERSQTRANSWRSPGILRCCGTHI